MTFPGPDQRLSPRPADDEAAAPPGPRGCPFLLADGGGWRLDVPSREHECTAVSPAAALSLEKQSRLCLTAAYSSCATFLASMGARGTRLGAAAPEHATRWGLTRTTAVIEDAGGMRSRVTSAITDRGRWPAVPAVLLLTGLIVLGLSGLRGTPASSIATPPATAPSVIATATTNPTSPATTRPTEAPPTSGPSSLPSVPPTSAPTARPTIVPPPTPGPSFRTYTVRDGDTLSAIASKFGTTSKAIADLNGIKVSTTLHAGDILKIPNT
ncbi:MAG TPA: LysM peptidoglycan-binding domain-containing protein [Candidatus Limnocylindrales bacterium]|nr:LysM peptidoglycan-binding domain-containing protein [Candidatus Limnocylindrales bacterium]